MDLGLKRPLGDITTLLDLTPRDEQDAEFTPLGAEKTWWQPSTDRRLHPFTLTLQPFPLRGPAAWGQRVTFDLGRVSCGDMLLATVLQLQLDHWIDPVTLSRLETETLAIQPAALPEWWFYANSIGSIMIAQAQLEIGDTIIETIDGDFISVFSTLYPDFNTQLGVTVDGFGRFPAALLGDLFVHPSNTRFVNTIDPSQNFWTPRSFPTERGQLLIPLPFFYQRVRLQEALPLLAIADGQVRIHITFRPFQECVRQLRGYRDSCSSTPLSQTITLTDISPSFPIPLPPFSIQTAATEPTFKTVQLLTYAANTDGSYRQAILRSPFEILHRRVDIHNFSEPLKYTVNKSGDDIISVQLPIDVNHPIEEILWFVRRKAVALNNEWTNFSGVLARDYNATYNPWAPLLLHAKLQINGIDVVSAEESWFRNHIATLHKGGIAPYNAFLYGYSFSRSPGQHQPAGTANASRAQSIRLCLDVAPPASISTLEPPGVDQEWEVKVFTIGLQWLRFQDGQANRMYMS